MFNLESIAQPFNLMVGAGISKAYPSHCPLWLDMVLGLVDAIIERIIKEGWCTFNCKEDFAPYRDRIAQYRFRPEQFWQMIRHETSAEFVRICFGILSGGAPNRTHKSIAKLLDTKKLKNVITTNFDEYIESCLTGAHMTAADLQDACHCLQQEITSGLVIKPHGTLSKDNSLIFTLSDTVQLNFHMRELIKSTLSGSPLVIAGYSGNDDDILPLLKEIQDDIPQIVVICHPSGSPDEPVRSLNGSNVRLTDDDAGTVISAFANIKSAPNMIRNDTIDDSCFAKAVDTLHMPVLPYLLSVLLNFTGDENKAKDMAVLAYDAVLDSRYTDRTERFEKLNIFMQTQLLCIKYDDFWETVIKTDMDIVMGPLSRIEMMTFRLTRAFGLICQPELTQPQINEIAETLTMADACQELHGRDDSVRLFSVYGFMGRLKRKQNKYDEAIANYCKAENCLKMMSNAAGMQSVFDNIGHVRLAGFYLGYGTCLFGYANGRLDNENLQKACKMYQCAKELSLGAHDWEIHLQSSVFLSRIYLYSGLFEDAEEQIRDAEAYCGLVKNPALQSVLAETKELVKNHDTHLKPVHAGSTNE